MKRYYSHYTFIYPDIYIKGFIVEIDDEGKITRLYRYEKEVEKTEFHSGLLIYMPVDTPVDSALIASIKDKDFKAIDKDVLRLPEYACKVYSEDLTPLN